MINKLNELAVNYLNGQLIKQIDFLIHLKISKLNSRVSIKIELCDKPPPILEDLPIIEVHPILEDPF